MPELNKQKLNKPQLTSSNMRLRVEVGISGLESLSEDWRNLSGRLDRVTLCHDLRWVTTLTKHLFAESMLFCLVYAESFPVAIFYLWRGLKVRGSFKYCALEGPTNAEFIVLADALIDPDYRQAALLHFVLKELNKKGETAWDVFSFSNCSERSSLCNLNNLDVYTEDTDNANAYVMCRSLDDLSELSRKQIKNIRRCERRAGSELGEVTFERSDPTTVKKYFESFIALENSGWKGDVGAATSIMASGEHAINFYHELLDAFSTNDDVKLYLLKFNEQIAAASICLRVGSVVHIYKIAYNEDLHQYSPGGMLLLHIFEAMAEEPGIDEVNLMTCPSWSKRWHMRTARVKQIRIYSHSYRATLFRTVRFVRNIHHGLKTVSAHKKSGNAAP